MYRRLGSDNKNSPNRSTDILSTLYDHDLSTDALDTSVFLESACGSQRRRRKSPLFDGELTSPKKKQKEMSKSPPSHTTKPVVVTAAATEPARYLGRKRYEIITSK